MALKKSQKSLKKWTKQKWRTKSGKKSSETGERYLPTSTIQRLTSAEYAATTRKKRKDTKAGKQHSNCKDEKVMAKVRIKRKTDPRLARAGVSGYNKPKRTPNHPTKSHIVVAKSGDQIKTIRFGQQGAKTAGKPKKGESEAMRKKRASFKARHRKNIARGPMSAAYWANKVKW